MPNSDSKKLRAQKVGRWGEWLCRLVLTIRGWRIISHRYLGRRGTGTGEVDIIARRGDIIAFIEVKTRPSLEAGLFAVSKTQQQRITKGAERFLANNTHLQNHDVRFDVMIVHPWRWPLHMENAWRAQDQWSR